MYLALNNLQRLIRHITEPTNIYFLNKDNAKVVLYFVSTSLARLNLYLSAHFFRLKPKLFLSPLFPVLLSKQLEKKSLVLLFTFVVWVLAVKYHKH